jgi:DNA-binding NarL/FixJ family response regulator
MEKEPIKVVLIEDDRTIREGYHFLIDRAEGYQIVGAYPSVEDALRHLSAANPHVILLDIELPNGQSGIEALPKIRQAVPKAQIIMLTVYDDAELIFRALSHGAIGYLTKNTSSSKIIEAIKDAREGGGPMSPNIARLVVQSFRKATESPLTRRETEILEHIANGKSRSSIARELFVDLETVKTHIKNIYAKLDVHSRAEAIKAAKDGRLI